MHSVIITITSFAIFATLRTTAADILTTNKRDELLVIVENLKKELKYNKNADDVLSDQFKTMAKILLNLDIETIANTMASLSELSKETSDMKKELEETKSIAGKQNTELAEIKKELLLKTSQYNITINDLTKEIEETRSISEMLKTELAEIKMQLLFKTSQDNITINNLTEEIEGMRIEFLDMTTNLTKELDSIKETANSAQETAFDSKIFLENSAKEIQKNFTVSNQELEEVKIKIGNLTKELMRARAREIVDIGKIPASCSDLQEIGYKTNGLFSVMGNKSIETVYCNFQAKEKELQKWIGSNDIKSMPTYFYVTRISHFSTANTPIPFDLAKVNIANAMELASGKFRAPRPGIYFFSFTGHAFFPRSVTELELAISLYLNDNRIGWAEVEEASITSDGQFSPLTLQSMIELKAGDQIWLQIVSISPGVVLFDRRNHYTHFTGWMLEENIVASL